MATRETDREHAPGDFPPPLRAFPGAAYWQPAGEVITRPDFRCTGDMGYLGEVGCFMSGADPIIGVADAYAPAFVAFEEAKKDYGAYVGEHGLLRGVERMPPGVRERHTRAAEAYYEAASDLAGAVDRACTAAILEALALAGVTDPELTFDIARRVIKGE